MMNKAKTAKVHVLRFLFILPLLVVVLLAFRNTVRQQQPLQTQGPIADTVPTLKRDSLKLSRDDVKVDTENVTHMDIISDESAPLPPSGPLAGKNIRNIDVNNTNGQELITITFKDGRVEKYNMKDPQEKAAFEKKYGKLPPPPNPPAAPAPPVIISDAPVKPENIRSIDIVKSNGRQLIAINRKDGGVEKYDLNDPKDKKTFEEKYGKIPLAPLPPPPAPDPTLAPPVPDGVAPAASPVPPAASAAVIKPDAAVSYAPLKVVKADPVIIADVRAASVPVQVLDIRSVGNSQVAVKSVNAVHAEPVIIADRIQVKLNDQHAPEAVGAIFNKFSEKQLDELKKDMQEKGYTLTIDNTTYVNGVLANVSGRVADGNGQKCSFSASDFRSVVIARQKKANGQPDGLLVLIESNTAAL